MSSTKRYCLESHIDGLLLFDDQYLQSLFGSYGPDIRHDLEERQAKGEIFIGSINCQGFDPITGCPGHEVKEVTNG